MFGLIARGAKIKPDPPHHSKYTATRSETLLNEAKEFLLHILFRSSAVEVTIWISISGGEERSRYQMRMDGWSSGPLSHESTKVSLLLSFVQKKGIPNFSLFKVINGQFSSWHLQRDLQSSARSDQDTLGNDASGGTNALHYIMNTVAAQDAERKSSVWAHNPHMSTLFQILTFLCFLTTSESACQTHKLGWFWAQAADLCTVFDWIVLHMHICFKHTQTASFTHKHSHYTVITVSLMLYSPL